MMLFTLHFQLHYIKSLIFCYIVGFFYINFSIHILDKNSMSLKANYLAISNDKQLASITKSLGVLSC